MVIAEALDDVMTLQESAGQLGWNGDPAQRAGHFVARYVLSA
jgi:hypothetical protein